MPENDTQFISARHLLKSQIPQPNIATDHVRNVLDREAGCTDSFRILCRQTKDVYMNTMTTRRQEALLLIEIVSSWYLKASQPRNRRTAGCPGASSIMCVIRSPCSTSANSRTCCVHTDFRSRENSSRAINSRPLPLVITWFR